jgi:hypothetical protein
VFLDGMEKAGSLVSKVPRKVLSRTNNKNNDSVKERVCGEI